jgi:8-oxo-dGTP pyrophosphatase MutT (NUDIX family)
VNYIDQIKEYKAQNEIEENEKRVIEDYIIQFPHNILSRENEFAHITSSGFIMNPGLDKVLMIHHNVYNTWTWTGGHADRDTDLLEIALKEAREETGIVNIKPLSTTIASLDIIPVWGHFKRGKYVCAHLHLNSAYILITEETEALILNKEETSGVRWIPINELEKYSNEPSVIVIYNNLIRKAKG